MRFKQLGDTNLKIPELGIGTWKMGSKSPNEIAAIRKAINLGMRFVDTAEMYANEQLVGEAIKGQGDLFLATKVSPHHFHYDDVIKACKISLTKLGVKSLDLYQLHWPSKSIKIGETMSAMEHLVDEGMIKHIGISNFSVEETKEAQAAMKKYQIVSNQVEYSLAVRDIEHDGLLDYCQKSKITIIAYSPIARGGIIDGSRPELSKALSAVALAHQKTPAQAALNWVISHDNVVAIPKSSIASHVEENFGAIGWKLSNSERKLIEDSVKSQDSLAKAAKPVMSRMGFISNLYQEVSNFKNRNLNLKDNKDEEAK